MGIGVVIEINGQDAGDLGSPASVDVLEVADGIAQYTLTYPISVIGNDVPVLNDSRLDPGALIGLYVSTEQGRNCLVKGPVTSQNIKLLKGGDGSVVEVNGYDESLLMEKDSKTVAWSGTTDSDVVNSILAQYGFNTDVDNTGFTHSEDKHVLMQRDTDMQFIRQLAHKNGFMFWMSADDTGIYTGHFKRPNLSGPHDVELGIINQAPNIDQLNIEWDVRRPATISSKQLELNQKTDISGDAQQSPLGLLSDKNLQTIVGANARTEYLNVVSDDATDLIASSESTLIDAGWFIRASCQTNLEVVKTLIRPHMLVNIQGAGNRHNGKYFTNRIKHILNESAHTMKIGLIRNAWGN